MLGDVSVFIACACQQCHVSDRIHIDVQPVIIATHAKSQAKKGRARRIEARQNPTKETMNMSCGGLLLQIVVKTLHAFDARIFDRPIYNPEPPTLRNLKIPAGF